MLGCKGGNSLWRLGISAQISYPKVDCSVYPLFKVVLGRRLTEGRLLCSGMTTAIAWDVFPEKLGCMGGYETLTSCGRDLVFGSMRQGIGSAIGLVRGETFKE